MKKYQICPYRISEFDSGAVEHGVLAVVQHAVLDNQIKVCLKFINGPILVTLDLIFHCKEVHWAFDHLKIVWCLENTEKMKKHEMKVNLKVIVS